MQLTKGNRGRCRRYTSDMSRRDQAKQGKKRQRKGRRTEAGSDTRHVTFTEWLHGAVDEDIARGNVVSGDVRALLLPPSRNAKGYRSMYAYGNHIRVRGAEVDLSTCDSGVAATFLQSCRSSSSDRNMRTTNLEYVGWVEEIISVDYGTFEVVVLYCTWARANKKGPRATMKCDEYGFTLFKFDRLIPYSADSFAFPLHVQQVFFVDDVANDGWKVVLRREPRGCRVMSGVDGGPDLQALQIGRDADHHGLGDTSIDFDRSSQDPMLAGCKVLTAEDVSRALEVRGEDPPSED